MHINTVRLMQLESIKTCPVCQKEELATFLTCKDYLVSQQNFTIQACLSCGFKLTNPRPDGTSIGQFYKSDQYVSHNDESKGLINKLYRLVRQYTLKSKLKLINNLNQGTGRLLDIGCGTGSFLEAANKEGWQIAGVEPDSDARTLSAQRLKIRVGEDIEEIDTNNSFNIITLWHVLEHIPTLDQTLQNIRQRLAPNGTLILALPNNASWDAQRYQEYWAAYDVPRHLHHFEPDTITKLLLRHGFRLEAKKPMYFDSFYIAMLSTRYRDGKTNMVESFINGLRSNWAATKTGQYSSLIYIFRLV